MDLLIAPPSQEREPPANSGRFKGLFRAGLLSEPEVLLLASSITETTEFEQFLTRCVETFWLNIADDLVDIRKVVAEQLRPEALRRLTALEDAIAAHAQFSPVPSLSDGIRRARIGLGQAFDRLEEWFARPEPRSAFTASVDELIDIGIESVRILHQSFSPRIQKDIGNVPPVANALELFSDMLFIIFENIHRHCGNPIDPVIKVSAVANERQLVLSIRSPISENVDIRVLALDLAARRQTISSGLVGTAATTEGGTGLYKLANRLKQAGAPVSALRFDTEERQFLVEFAIAVRVLT